MQQEEYKTSYNEMGENCTGLGALYENIFHTVLWKQAMYLLQLELWTLPLLI